MLSPQPHVDRLPPGHRLGPYEILGPAGSGGMGEVYRARDLRLDRQVAIKTIRGEFALAKARFAREAKAIGGLNHPNICTLHDVGEVDGVGFLVMEYVEGHTLSRILDSLRGRSRAEEPRLWDDILQSALDRGREIAAALDVAHRQGIVHRDLKPANIMITRSGVKLLDFGVAKLLRDEEKTMAEAAPTLQQDGRRGSSGALTSPSNLVGTLRYMAPEQVRGLPVDARSDIFAFGAVLYEMLTLERAFDGDHDGIIMRAVVERDPPAPSTVNPRVPQHIDRLVLECLAKDPLDRWQSAGDVRRQLASVSDSATTNVAVVAPTKRTSPIVRQSLLRWLPWLLAGAAVAALIVQVASRHPKTRVPTISSTLPVPGLAWPTGFALSRDGSRLAFIQRGPDGVTRVAIREMSGWDVHTVLGTDGVTALFFGPDASTLAVGIGDTLSRIDLTTGSVSKLSTSGDAIVDGAWDASAGIVYATSRGLLIRAAATGWQGFQPKLLFDDAIRRAHPRFVSGGRYLLFTAHGEESRLQILDLESGAVNDVTRVTTGTQFLDGYLLYEEEALLAARPFSPETLALGKEQNLRTGLYPGRRGVPFSLADNGTLVLQTAARPDTILRWLDDDGRPRRHQPLGLVAISFAIARDGRTLMVSAQDTVLGRRAVYVSSDHGGFRRLFAEERADLDDPMFAPQGGGVAYVAHRSPTVVLHRRSLQEPPTTLYTASGVAILQDWSADGAWLVLLEKRPPLEDEIVLVPVADREAKPRRQRVQPWSDQLRISPDGSFVVYTVHEKGAWRVMAVALRDGAVPVLVASVPGLQPRFAADGKRVLFISLDGTLLGVPIIASDPTPVFGKPTELFATGISDPSPTFDDFDVGAAGQGYVVAVPNRASAPETLIVTSDWRHAFAVRDEP